MKAHTLVVLLAVASLFAITANAACRDNVVLVHGHAGSPSDFNNTWNELRARGYATNQIYRPS